jgi:hypothetical protein
LKGKRQIGAVVGASSADALDAIGRFENLSAKRARDGWHAISQFHSLMNVTRTDDHLLRTGMSGGLQVLGIDKLADCVCVSHGR